MASKAKTKRLYLIPVLTKALDILELLQTEAQPMMLETIHKRTKISKTTVYRILKTLVHRGYVGQTADRHYRHIARPKKLRFGFAGQSAENAVLGGGDGEPARGGDGGGRGPDGARQPL